MAKKTKNKQVYERDICGFGGKALSVIFPDSEEEIQQVVRHAGVDIVPRGAGTSFAGGCVPNESIVIDMSKMDKILKIDSSRKIATVEAGARVSELNAELEDYGLEFPIKPLFSGISTIGGIIALNSAGDREIKYGRTINWIDSLEVINGNGELVRISKADASDFAGLEGITGIIVRANLRLTTKKQRTLSVLKSDSIEEIIRAGKKLRLIQEVSMIALLSKKLSLMNNLENKYHLFVEFEDNQGSMSGESYRKFMKLKDKSYYTLASHGFTLLENPKFFVEDLMDFCIYLEGKNIPYFCNMGSSIVYACFNAQEEQKHKEVLDIIRRIRAKASYTLGIGLIKKDFIDKSEREILKRIKKRYDPEWKFNRNKIIDAPEARIAAEEPKLGAEHKPELEELQAENKRAGVQAEIKQEEQKTPEQEIHEFIEEQKIDELLALKPDKSMA